MSEKKLPIIINKKRINFVIIKITKTEVTAKHESFKYEGEHVNLKATGKGILYNHDKKYMEGTWKNGAIIHGKKFNLKKDGTVEYEGTFKNGVYDGNGVLLTNDSFLEEKYEGIFKDGMKNGMGRVYYHDQGNWNLDFEGNFKRDKKCGFGKEYLEYGSKIRPFYVGDFRDDDYHGKGTMYMENGDTIIGTFKNGVIHGKAIEIYANMKQKFEGTFRVGKRHGSGTEYYESGNRKAKGKYKNGYLEEGTEFYDNEKNSKSFEGTFRGRQQRRKGTSYYENGNKSKEGRWDNNGFQKGRKYRRDGQGYEEGRYLLGERNGYCRLYYNRNNSLSEKGNWLNGYRNGLHYIYFENGQLIFKGYFSGTFRNGKGTEYWENGKIKENGFYLNGKLHCTTGSRYAEDGKLKEEGHFQYGNLEIGTKYFENGEYITGVFQKNLNNGNCTEYWENKKKKSVGFWVEGVKNGEFSEYFNNGKLQFKGTYKDGIKDGPGKEYNLDGKVERKGYWKDGVYIGKVAILSPEQIFKKQMIQENNIKKYLQTSDKKHLKYVKVNGIKNYLKTYAKKDAKGKTKASLVKELQKWRQQLKQQKKKQLQKKQQLKVPSVFNVLQSEYVPVTEFLKDENRIVLTMDNTHYFGVYLDQSEIFYECKVPQIAFHQYVGNKNVNGIVRLTTDQGKYYFLKTDSLLQDMKKGYNLFHFKTNPKDVRILSKAVAQGADFLSANHCDPDDVIKLSETFEKEKIGDGLKSDLDFEF